MWYPIIGVVCLIVGFVVGKFWRSRKIDETVKLAKDMAKIPTVEGFQEKAKQIREIWK